MRTLGEEILPTVERMIEDKGIIFECRNLEWGF